jgi:hypothetical protein
MPAVRDDPGLAAELESAVASLRPVTLDVLDERARLQRRVDRKYIVRQDRFGEILAELEDDQEALEIGGRRRFAYESVYFDTSGRSPRSSRASPSLQWTGRSGRPPTSTCG